MIQNKKYDYLIVGAGIVGLTIAYELNKRYPDCSIAIIEKENDVAKHASGRNSGVLHAGFYYTENSLKAKLTMMGNKKMKEFCYRNNISVNETEKIVVAQNKEELQVIDELYSRAKKNGVNVSIISSDEVKKIDSNIKTYKKALYSPTTASVNPKEVCIKLKQNLINKGIKFKFNYSFENVDFEYDYLINCAGLYADKIAKKFGLASDYTILPFRGAYLKYNGTEKIINKNVYPVPNLKNPFLGVHFTITSDNHIKIGPTSSPALWRENYGGFSGFNMKEFFTIIFYQGKLFLLNSFGFRGLAFEAIKNFFKRSIIYSAGKLVYDVNNNFSNIKPGIRAQLLNTSTNELVQDFVIQHAKNSTHILNAVSPAFTCSFAFADYTVSQIEEERKSI
jgi:L-2-hydroxyglutarate oxidase